MYLASFVRWWTQLWSVVLVHEYVVGTALISCSWHWGVQLMQLLVGLALSRCTETRQAWQLYVPLRLRI